MISGKQVFVALSTTDTMYIATGIASRKAVHIQNLLAGIYPRLDAQGGSEALVHIHR
jgi:hypothetical protein